MESLVANTKGPTSRVLIEDSIDSKSELFMAPYTVEETKVLKKFVSDSSLLCHSRHRLLCDKADMPAVLRSRHVGSVTWQH